MIVWCLPIDEPTRDENVAFVMNRYEGLRVEQLLLQLAG